MTTAELLTVLAARGIRLYRAGARLLVDAPAGVLGEAERRALAAQREELLVVVDFGPDVARLVSWFRRARGSGRLPAQPFALTPWQTVVEPGRFYAALEADIAAGPRGARRVLGGWVDRLRRLQALVDS
jgi:hypothetical protein